MSNYKGILTNKGKELLANAAMGNRVNFSHLALGDGNGSTPTLNETRTALVKERHRLTLNSVDINPNNRNQIICEVIIPTNIGGFTVRELGLFAGNFLVMHSTYPPTYKPRQDEGGAREMVIRVVINVQNADVVALYLDTSLVYATRGWVETNFINHNEVIDNLTSTDTNKPLSAAQGKKLNTDKANKTTQFTAGAGLTGGGDLSASRSLSLGTPSKITANSTNTAVSNTHSHEIDKASTTTAGIVQLVDNLGSNANNQALTAKQGKVLNDNKLGNTGTQTLNGILKITSNQWGKFNLPLQDGTQWWIEANPNYKTAINGQAVLRFLHMDGSARCYYDLVKSGNNEVIAYQSWVQQGFVSKTTTGTITGKKTFTDEIVSTTPNALRLKNTRTNQSVFFRFDGNHLYLMKTATGDGDGTWDNTRPLVWNVATDSLSIKGNLNGNATTATKLHTPRTLSMTGDGTWSVPFDGTNNVSATLTLANTGVRAGSYNSVTVDAKGRVIAGLTQTHGLITATSATGTTNTATNNSNTFLNIVASGVGSASSVGSSTQITGTNGINVSSDTAGKLIISQAIANNLTDNSTTKPLSANMGKVLKEELTALDGRKFEQRGVLDSTDLNSLTATNHMGIWHQTYNINATADRNYPIQKAGTLFVLPSAYIGQQLYFPFDEAIFYKRTTNAQGVYGNWMKIGGLANTLGSTSTTDALTAAQGKILKEQIDTKLASHANAVSATKLQTPRQIALTGAVTGSVNFDGSGNVIIPTTLTKAVVREYNRTINGTATGQTTNTMQMVGQVVVGADGRITQYFHLKHFRDFWFLREDNAVGYQNNDGTSFVIPIVLWTAMPNKILSVSAQTMRSTNPTSSAQYQSEAAEHVLSWDKRKTGNATNQFFINISRFRGGSSEHIDLFLTVEGY